MLSLIDKNKRKNRFCQFELERMQADNAITMSEKFLTLKPATLQANPSELLTPKMLWLEHDNLGM